MSKKTFPKFINILFLLYFILLANAAEKLPYGAKLLDNGDVELNGAILRRAERELLIPCNFVLQSGPLEVIIAKPDGRMHETLLSTKIPAVQIQMLLYLLGAENGYRLSEQNKKQGDIIDLYIEYKDAETAEITREALENWIFDTRTNKTLERIGWVFVGSTVRNGIFQADAEGNVVINYSVGSTVLDSPDPQSLDDTIHTVNEIKKQPGEEQEVFVVFKPRKKTE